MWNLIRVYTISLDLSVSILSVNIVSVTLQALRYLGIEPTAEQEAEMMSKLKVDPKGTVNYGGKASQLTFLLHKDVFLL